MFFYIKIKDSEKLAYKKLEHFKGLVLSKFVIFFIFINILTAAMRLNEIWTWFFWFFVFFFYHFGIKTGNFLVEKVYFWDRKYVAEVRIVDFELYMPEGVCGSKNLSSNDLLG